MINELWIKKTFYFWSYVDLTVVSLRCPPGCSMVEHWKNAEIQLLSTVSLASDPCLGIGLFLYSSLVRAWSTKRLTFMDLGSSTRFLNSLFSHAQSLASHTHREDYTHTYSYAQKHTQTHANTHTLTLPYIHAYTMRVCTCVSLSGWRLWAQFCIRCQHYDLIFPSYHHFHTVDTISYVLIRCWRPP